MAQALATQVEQVMFLARVKNNPSAFLISVNGTATDLVKDDSLGLYMGLNPDIELNTPFNLSVGPAEVNNIEELMMVVKYSFNANV